MRDYCFIDSLSRHIGQTVTIFTASGGVSGAGFTGVLAGVTDCSVKLITAIGTPPACPCGGDCTGWGIGGLLGGLFGGGCDNACGNSYFGAVTEIPVDRIVSFTHSTI
ncbi:MAG: hypothetical protein LBB94_11945 [Clostridiales bacterium]|jgi:hypothetical protein|nr:hypothetical protein [Clostridiales bacterium]